MKNIDLLSEIKKICNALSKYDRSYFNEPATEPQLNVWERRNKVRMPMEVRELLRFANGFRILGRTAEIYSVDRIGFRSADVPDEFVIFGEIVGDGEKICFNWKTGKIVTFHDGQMFDYSVSGFLRYCLDQCEDGIFMEGVCPDDLSPEILEDMENYQYVKPEMIQTIVEVFEVTDFVEKRKLVFGIPIFIRAIMFSNVEDEHCNEFLEYLRKNDRIEADNLLRSMRRRALDNYFNRERKFLDKGGSTYLWNETQMREMYNYYEHGEKYHNAGIVYDYDENWHNLVDVAFNRAGEHIVIFRKMKISYLYDVHNYVRCAGNMNNIRLKK